MHTDLKKERRVQTMEDHTFRLSFKTTTDPKVSARVIAAALFTEYTDKDDSYTAGHWMIGKNGMMNSPETSVQARETICPVLNALATAEVQVEGDITVTIPLRDSSGKCLRNLINLIWSKHSLIQKALARPKAILHETLVTAVNSRQLETIEELAYLMKENGDLELNLADKTLSFSFCNGTLNADEVLALVSLCHQMTEQALKLNVIASRQRETDNDKFSFRVWLVRLGFVGGTFAKDRQVLLARLTGDAAYKTAAARESAKDKRNLAKPSTTLPPNEGGAN
jgi:hypothetical protein